MTPQSSSDRVPMVRTAQADLGLEMPSESAQPLDWPRFVSAARRYRWWVLGLAGLGIVGGIGAARLLPPSYQVQATIWIQSSEPAGTSRGPIGSNQLFQSYAWVDLLKSYVVLDQVARDMRLYLSPERGANGAFGNFAVSDTYTPGRYRIVADKTGQSFRLLDANGEELQQGAIGDSVGTALGFRWVPGTALHPGSDFTFTVRPLRDAARKLGSALAVTLDPGGNFLRLGLTTEDAKRGAATVNAVAQRYVEVGADLKRAKLHQLGTLLDEQLRAARENLRRAEGALEQFQVGTATFVPADAAPPSSAGRDAAFGSLFAPKLEQEQLRRDRSAIQQVLARMRDSGGSPEGLAFIGAVQRTADVSQALRDLTVKRADERAMSARYTPEHPAVQQLRAEITTLEQRTIPALAESLSAELQARERVLAPQIAAGEHELRGIPQRSIDAARLKRDVELATTLFTSVQQRSDEARLAEASSIADVRVLDVAVPPQEPLKDKASRLLFLGLLAGLGLGLVGAVLADRMDPRMRYPDQVTRQMGLPILGVLPHVKDRAAGPDDEEVAQVIEAMRSVRLSLMHFYGGNGPVVVTITSPGAGDGKSFVSANLALACAESGKATLLIDGDSRRGALHRVLHRPRKLGLTDFLAGAASLEAVTQSTPFPNLDFIAAGSRYKDSPELLGYPTMVELLQHARAHYGVVIVDSSPLGSGVDPYTLGTLTGSLLLVLRTGTTNLELARTKLAVLDHLPIRLLGAVLNDVHADGLYRHYSYLSGYATVDEQEGYAIAGRKAHGVL